MPDQSTIELGGRSFSIPVDRTIENDIFIEESATRAGLGDLQIRADEAPEEFARRLLGDALRSGVLLPLLGGLLIPSELAATDWTPEVARATAAHLAKLTSPDDKNAIRAILAAALARFFLIGTASATTSPSYSAGAVPSLDASPASSLAQSPTTDATEHDLAGLVPSGEA